MIDAGDMRAPVPEIAEEWPKELFELTDDELYDQMQTAMDSGDFDLLEKLDAEEQTRKIDAAEEAWEAEQAKYRRTKAGRKALAAERAERKALWDSEVQALHDEVWRTHMGGGSGIRRGLEAESLERGLDTLDLMTMNDPWTAYKFAAQDLVRGWDSIGGRRPDWMSDPDITPGERDKRMAAERDARSLAEEMWGELDYNDAKDSRQKKQSAYRKTYNNRIGGTKIGGKLR